MSGTNVRYNIFLFRIHYWLSAYDICTIAAYLYDFFELKVLYYELKMEKLSVINIVMLVVEIPQRIKSTFFCFFCNCFDEKIFSPKSYFFHILAYCGFCLKEQSHSKIFNPYYYKLQNVPPIKTWFALLLNDNIVKKTYLGFIAEGKKEIWILYIIFFLYR